MLKRKTPLKRGGFIKRQSKLSPVSDRRRVEMAEYRKLRETFLREHPICEVWCAENGWTWFGPDEYHRNPKSISEPIWVANGAGLVGEARAPRATQVHHTNKRRGKMLLQVEFWIAVSRENHERIEREKKWARENGFLLNF